MRILAWLLSSAMFFGILGILVLVLVVKHYSQDLPDVAGLRNYNPPVVSRVHAGDGRLMAEFATERRVFVPINRIPQRVIDAFLSAEDKTFYTHPGVDFFGIAGAVVKNLANAREGRRMVGASTITQQVAKNFLVGNERSIERKIREAVLAFRMEEAYSKDQILELYLNEIFLGQRAYGVGSAALAYFNKTLDELTVADAAYLAALPKAPNNYNPEKNHEAAIERRNWVLGRMLEDGKILRPEYEAAIAQDVVMRPRDENEFYRGGGYFTEEIRRELVSRYGEKAVLEGGLLVRATVDPRLQDAATKALQDGLINYDRQMGWRGPVVKADEGNVDGGTLLDKLKATLMPGGGELWTLAVVQESGDTSVTILFADGTTGVIPLSELKWAKSGLKRASDVLHSGEVVLVEKVDGGENTYGLRQIPAVQGGLVAMDANTGRVLAMVGGFSPQMSAFNRATQAWRQPGSSFKPYVYMTALENGFTPSSLVLDAPISLPQGPGLPMWTPANYEHDFLGPTTLRRGLEKSRNLMTVRLAAQLGIEKVAATAEAFGVVDHLPHNLSMSLGAGETTVLRQTGGYAQIVNGGRKITPSLIDSVQNKAGKILYRHDDRSCVGCERVRWHEGLGVPKVPDTRVQVIDARTAYQMVHIMEGVVQRGTGRRVSVLKWPLAGKTGTSNDAKDAWFVGFSSDMAVGVYVGFDQPKPLGKHQTGGSVAAPIFRDFMAEALKGTPPVPFRVPPGVRMVRVNVSTGQLAEPWDEARDVIWEAFKPGTEPRPGTVETAIDPVLSWDAEETDTQVLRVPDDQRWDSAGAGFSSQYGGDSAQMPAGGNRQQQYSAPIPSYLPPPSAGQGGSSGGRDSSGSGSGRSPDAGLDGIY